ncbi:MAG: thioesterase family protein [Gammaproteobacteria bacterium]|nr:thioesterase family protein [Gammaproteobacteria bacterium]
MSQTLCTDDVRAMIAEFFGQQMPFHHLIGLEIVHYNKDSVELRIEMKPALVGNTVHGILHGGVTATMLDVAGGMIVFAEVLENMAEVTQESVFKRLQNLGTIDLRIDYLRPGRGTEFIATATVIRAGNKVAVARMELHNEQGDHIAFGTGTYMVG